MRYPQPLLPLTCLMSSGVNLLRSGHLRAARKFLRRANKTGSRCYVAQLHEYNQSKNQDAEPAGVNEDESIDQVDETDEEIDALEAFRVCHTSRKKGMSDAAREALASMETMRSEPVADGEPPLRSAEVVSKVLSQNSSSCTFLKNAGIATPSSKSRTANEEELRQQLASERQGSAVLHDQEEELKKKTEAAEEALARTQQQYEELKNQQEESNIILRKILDLREPGTSSQP